MRDHLSARMEQLIVSPLPCNYVCHARYSRPGVLACFAVFAISRAISVFFAPISGRRLVKRITGKRKEKRDSVKNISSYFPGKVISNDRDLGLGFENAAPPPCIRMENFASRGNFVATRGRTRSRKVGLEIGCLFGDSSDFCS